MIRRVSVLSATFSFVALTACGGGSNGPLPPPKAGNVTGTIPSAGITTRIVGVGDSLTAGEQSGALLGISEPNPLYPATSPFPFVQDTQSHGYYALMWSQANNGANPLNPAISPLPLMRFPGVGTILLPTNTGSLTSLQEPCGGLNAFAFNYGTAVQTRIFTGATPSSPLDVAVPGQTLHEALYQFQLTAPCDSSNLPTPFNALGQIFQDENNYLYPVLSTFGQGTTQLQAATRLEPTMAVVWLGSNDLLKFLGGNGALPPTDPAAFQTDITTVITSLQRAGAKVAVANLIDVLDAPYFAQVSNLQAVYTGLFILGGVPPAEAAAIAAGATPTVQAFLLTSLGLGPNGYLTLSGQLKTAGAIEASLPPQNIPLQDALKAAGLGAGDFVSANVAVEGVTLEAAYNAATAAAAAQTGAAVVDIHGAFAPIFAAGGVPINPGVCCSTAYGGGLFSTDGIHPSNTGYALTANVFIGTVDQAFGANIPPLSQTQISAINAADPYAPPHF